MSLSGWVPGRFNLFRYKIGLKHSKSPATQNCSQQLFMMTSSHGYIFRVTDHLCGEFTGHRSIPHTKASDAEFHVFCSWINGWVNIGEPGDLRHHHAHCDITVMFMLTTKETSKLCITAPLYNEIQCCLVDSPHKGPVMHAAFHVMISSCPNRKSSSNLATETLQPVVCFNPRRFIQYFCHFAELEDYWLSDSRVNPGRSEMGVCQGSNMIEKGPDL